VSLRERVWLLVLAASFVLGLAASWQRWANPVIDGGREMNQPARLAEGETLYSQVGHIYGPLSPWLHAWLYRAFGRSLDVLYADGIVSSVVILALVYYLARRIMDPPGAATATLLVMWLCAFKPSGNYVFPYAFSALHGTLLSLLTLTVCAAALERPAAARFVFAGLLAGATLLAKTEMGLGAVCAGVTAAALAQTSAARRILFAGAFVGGAAAVAGLVYAVIAARVGWRTLVFDSWLLGYGLPAPLAHFNASVSGLDRPLQSFVRASVAFIKLALLGTIVAALAQFHAGPAAERTRAWVMLAVAAVVAGALGATTGLDWDRGPFLAMPLLLVLLVFVFARGRRPLLVLYCVFALAQLARIILHVRSGGAYGSFLLPLSIVVFTYAWIATFPGLLRRKEVADTARSMALGLLIAAAAGTAIAISARYRRVNTTPIATARGTMIVAPEIAIAWNEALAFIAGRTRAGDPLVVLPEGTSLTFLSGRRNPIREEIVTPGFLNDAAERRAIGQIDAAATPLILIVNRPTREFGAETFGVDYNRTLMDWISSRYAPCGAFGPTSFVRAYCRKPTRI
jgi:Dolichyl-phosphate-mannose-protein mannosyltransferase